MKFNDEARAAQIQWKQSSTTLPAEARAPGEYRKHPYDFCLPAEYATCNLLPEARATVDQFALAEIVWHVGVNGGPTNHLCSSQVMCVNALAPFAKDTEALQWLFGDALAIAEMLAVDEHGDLVEFEWIGTDNLLGEFVGGTGTRGAHTTSADAAIRYRTTAGTTELALIEWKYTEQYPSAQRDDRKQATRDQRYHARYEAADGPIHTDKIPYLDLYYEPVYQLFRLTLLARELERTRADLDRVRVVYCAPKRNAALWASMKESHLAVGADLATFWMAMQRDPERFVVVDTARFVADAAPTSAEFKARYGHIDGRAT